MKIEAIMVIASGLIAALATDYSAYWKAKENDPTAKFAWKLAVKRWFLGLVSGGGLAGVLEWLN